MIRYSSSNENKTGDTPSATLTSQSLIHFVKILFGRSQLWDILKYIIYQIRSFIVDYENKFKNSIPKKSSNTCTLPKKEK